MPIDNIVSILPDPEYVRALERKLAALEARLDRIELDVINNR